MPHIDFLPSSVSQKVSLSLGSDVGTELEEAAGVGKDNKRKLWSAIKQIKYNFRYVYFLSCCFLCVS